MPNRIIRESCRTSATLFRLSDGAERMFWRLITVADDFGRFESELRLLKAACFPMWDDRLKIDQVGAWYAEMETCELVQSYVVNGKPFGFFITWEQYQDRRAKRSKHPDPTSANICEQMPANVPVSVSVSVSVSESVSDPMSGKVFPTANGSYRHQAREILDWLNTKTGKRFERVEANLKPIESRLREGREVWQLKKLVSVKVKAWGADEKMREYLRPATLFNKTKCAQYIGELPAGTEPELLALPPAAENGGPA